MAGMRMSMGKIREVLWLRHGLGLTGRQGGGLRLCEARQGGRDHVADPAGDRRRRVEAAAVHAAGQEDLADHYGFVVLPARCLPPARQG
jgi:hypothetical protein